MFADIFIFVVCLGALVYWMRHTVLTILAGDHAAEEAVRLAEANRLEFIEVRQALQLAASFARHNLLAESLGHDFVALKYLLRAAPPGKINGYSSEERLLMMDFHLMRILYVLSRWFAPQVARSALIEMTTILEHFAATVAQRFTSAPLDFLGA